MDLHQSMYKMNRGALTPNRTNQTKREEVNANRLKNRQDMYSRRISLSPSPCREARISATSTPAAELRLAADRFKATLTATQMDFDVEDKENRSTRQEQQQQQQEPSPKAADKSEYASRIVVKPSGTRATEKVARQEAYLMRFIEWKEQQRKKKEAKAQQKKQQVRPFVPVATGGSTFMPPRSQQFRAPEGLKNPATEGPMAVKSLRKSFYTPVPTPPRKEKPESIVKKKVPISQLAATHRPIVARKPITAPVRAPNVSRDAATTSKGVATTLQPRKAPTKTAPKPPKTETKTAAKVETFPRKPPAITITKPTPTVTTLKTSIPPRTRTVSTEPKPAVGTSAKTTKKTSPIVVRNRSRQLMPPPAVKAAARVVKPIRGGGGVAKTDSNFAGSGASKKAKLLQSNKAGVATISKPAKLSVSMKAKKPVAAKPLSRIGSQGANEMKRQYAKNLLGLPTTSFSALETPTELEGKNPFDPKVTSTNLKALPTDFEALLETTPGRRKSDVGEERKLSGTMRELLLKEEEPVPQTKTRFNFVRYSEANTLVDIEDVTVVQPKDEETLMNGVNKLEETKEDITNEEKAQQVAKEFNDEDFESPKRQDVPERPINYLSPFVSVSRGKVNTRAEKIKRNSIYLVGDDGAENETIVDKTTPPRAAAETPPARPATPVETRRTLEAVLYFRKQLSDTIDRLHELCDQWNAYREENTERLQETNGEDMINVTIGQTKLLTSKKFMQFKGLIDRCEAQARGEGPPDDGSEKTKLITSVDLEGFWVMLGIQVDNLDQRFENLQRWKANDWNDPDEVAAAAAVAKATKVKKNLTKVKKPKEASAATKKAKPNSALLQMMRKMHAEMRKNKPAGQEEETDIVVAGGAEKPATPKRNSISAEQPSTPSSSRRYSYILVRDRKSFSKAPTVLKVPTPQRESSNERTSEVRDLLRATLIGNEQKRRLSSAMAGSPRVASFGQPEQSEECTPVRPKSRKSILKTPGTAKSHRKSVVFANRVRQFKFTVKDGSDDDDKSDDEEQRKSANSEVELKRCHGEEEPQEDGPEGSSRMYSLRTRKVALRPSCEIVIPK